MKIVKSKRESNKHTHNFLHTLCGGMKTYHKETVTRGLTISDRKDVVKKYCRYCSYEVQYIKEYKLEIISKEN